MKYNEKRYKSIAIFNESILKEKEKAMGLMISDMELCFAENGGNDEVVPLNETYYHIVAVSYTDNKVKFIFEDGTTKDARTYTKLSDYDVVLSTWFYFHKSLN